MVTPLASLQPEELLLTFGAAEGTLTGLKK